MALQGFDADQISEASWAAQVTTGLSVYLYGIDYSIDKFKDDLARQVDHIKKSM